MYEKIFIGIEFFYYKSNYVNLYMILCYIDINILFLEMLIR